MMHHRTREAEVLAGIALHRGVYAKCWTTQHHRTKEAEVLAGITQDRGVYDVVISCFILQTPGSNEQPDV